MSKDYSDKDHLCLACGRPMERTSDGFECRKPHCGVAAMGGRGSFITEDNGVVTIHIQRDAQDVEE